MPKLSVNLVAYNGEKFISPCLTSVLTQNFRDFSVLMIDNGSHDRTREEIKKWAEIFKKEGIEARTIFLDKNIGFAGGHNTGFKVQSLKFKVQNNNQISNFQFPMYVCCLNQDIILTPEFFGKIVDFMDAHPECGSASGKLLSVSDKIYAKQQEYESLPAQAGEYARKIPLLPHQNFWYGSLSPFKKGGTSLVAYEMLEKECKIVDSVGLKIFKSHRVIEKGQGEVDNGQYDKIEEVFGVSGAAPVYRYAALEDIKSSKFKVKSSKLRNVTDEEFEYFDEDFFSYKEDVDLAYRLRWRGWKSFTVPVAAYHKRTAKDVSGRKNDFSAAFNRKSKSKFANYYSQRNQLFLIIKNLPKINFAVLWYEGKKFIYEFLFEWSTFKAWVDALKKIRVMMAKRRWIMENRKVSVEEIEKWFD